MRTLLLGLVLIASACSVFRDPDAVALRDVASMPDVEVGPADMPPELDSTMGEDVPDLGMPDAAACAAVGERCTPDTVCCDLGECGAQGVCRARPCTVSDDCGGLQCVLVEGSVEARACAQPRCAACEGQNWCHPTLGCTNKTPCASSETCAASQVCTSSNVCAETCRSSGECGTGECVELPPEQLLSVSDQGARTCRAAVCNCRDADEYCAPDGVCVLDDATCSVDADCGASRYICDGVRCVCDDSQPDVCRFACATNADCDASQICDPVLRRCQTQFCAIGGSCPAGYTCAPMGDESPTPMICRAAGALADGEACEASEDCASAMCVGSICSRPCRQTSDCDPGENCTFSLGFFCVPQGIYCRGEACEAGEFCVIGGSSCQPFCTSSETCPGPDQQCVTGFGIFNCNFGLSCPVDQLKDLFTDQCVEFCWTDDDCSTGNCDEVVNRCRESM